MLRQKALEDERIRLADIIKFFNIQKEALKELEEKLISLQKEGNFAFENNFNPMLINNYQAYTSKLSSDILNQKEVIKKINFDIEKQKIEVKKAYVKVKILEKLKEKQKEKYNKEVLLEEIKFIDDIMTSRKK